MVTGDHSITAQAFAHKSASCGAKHAATWKETMPNMAANRAIEWISY